MKRIMFMVFRLIYIAPFWFYKINKMGKSDKYSEAERYAFLHRIIKKINRAGRVVIKAYGIENLPKENGFIMFPNHQGLYDVLGIIESNPRPFGAVIKKEVANVILVKQVIRLLKGLVLDREDIKDAARVIRQMSEEVKNGRNYLIFAEGTRSREGNKLLEFKAGSFKSAIHAKCPIVPVALIDSFKPFDSDSIEKVEVQVHYLDALYYDDYKHLKSKEIAGLVRDRIEDTIQKFAL